MVLDRTVAVELIEMTQTTLSPPPVADEPRRGTYIYVTVTY